MKTIGIIGGGAWGSALANVLAQNNNVSIYCRSDTIRHSIINNKSHPSLKNAVIHSSITAVSKISEISSSEIIFIAVPVQQMRSALSDFISQCSAINITQTELQNKIFVLCSKGMELHSSLFPAEILNQIIPSAKNVILSGPNFAKEVALHHSVITTLASKCTHSLNVISSIFNNTSIIPEISYDPIGVQICGAMKNIFAIGSGLIDGLGLGQSTISSYISVAAKELQTAILKSDGAQNTILTAAGIGDFVLTCGNIESRNYRFGFELAKGNEDFHNTTVEGYHTAKSIHTWSSKNDIVLPICTTLYNILYLQHDKNTILTALHNHCASDRTTKQ